MSSMRTAMTGNIRRPRCGCVSWCIHVLLRPPCCNRAFSIPGIYVFPQFVPDPPFVTASHDSRHRQRQESCLVDPLPFDADHRPKPSRALGISSSVVMSPDGAARPKRWPNDAELLSARRSAEHRESIEWESSPSGCTASASGDQFVPKSLPIGARSSLETRCAGVPAGALAMADRRRVRQRAKAALGLRAIPSGEDPQRLLLSCGRCALLRRLRGPCGLLSMVSQRAGAPDESRRADRGSVGRRRRDCRMNRARIQVFTMPRSASRSVRACRIPRRHARSGTAFSPAHGHPARRELIFVDRNGEPSVRGSL